MEKEQADILVMMLYPFCLLFVFWSTTRKVSGMNEYSDDYDDDLGLEKASTFMLVLQLIGMLFYAGWLRVFGSEE